jgi:hypothetical protein
VFHPQISQQQLSSTVVSAFHLRIYMTHFSAQNSSTLQLAQQQDIQQ